MSDRRVTTVDNPAIDMKINALLAGIEELLTFGKGP
jgi:hypothetical protein